MRDDFTIQGYASEFQAEGVHYLSNATFKGQRKNIVLRARTSGTLKDLAKFHLFAGKISKGYFDYVKTRSLNDNEAVFFSERPPMGNDIQGGLGIFAAYSSGLFSFKK